MTSRETHPDPFALDIAEAAAAAVVAFDTARPLRGVLVMIKELHEHGDLEVDDCRLYLQCWQGLRLHDAPARRVRLDGWFTEILAERDRLMQPQQCADDGEAA